MHQWEILAQDVNSQGHEFMRGTDLFFEAETTTDALKEARKQCPGVDPKFISVRNADTELKLKCAPWPADRVKQMQEPACWVDRKFTPFTHDIKLVAFSQERGFTDDFVGGVRQITPKPGSDLTSFTFEVTIEGMQVRQTLVLPSNPTTHLILKTVATLVEAATMANNIDRKNKGLGPPPIV